MPNNETTSLLERDAILRELDEALARAAEQGTSVSAVVCDIDRFRHLLAELGDAASQDIIDQVGSSLADALGEGVLLGRMTADEFLAVVRDADAEGAVGKAENARAAVEKMEWSITLSAGVASYPQDAQDRIGLVHKAAEALNHAKHSGKNCVCRAGDNDVKTISIRVPKSLASRLSEQARKAGKEESALIHEAIAQYLESNKA